MKIDISDLPPAYQKQAAQKMAAQQKTAPISTAKAEPKYHNIPTKINDVKFPSQHEGERYVELMLLLEVGKIRDLRLQVNFTLQEGYTTPEGKRIRPIVYKADFVYHRDSPVTGADERIVEDAKSKPTKTKTYLMKKKMLQDKYGIEITEV